MNYMYEMHYYYSNVRGQKPTHVGKSLAHSLFCPKIDPSNFQFFYRKPVDKKSILHIFKSAKTHL